MERRQRTCEEKNSRATAIRRLSTMIPKLRRDDEKRARVFTEMNKFVEKGYATRVVDEDDAAAASNPRWYLPLHVVVKGNKTRVCHDTRAATSGICLNDLLHGNMNLNNELATIICLFRTEKVAFTTDICAFFHNILVAPEDADAFRY